MPKNKVIAEGKTTNEAIEKGLKELHVTKNMVNIKVLESGEKRSFFSILAPRVVKVELTLKEENSRDVAHKTTEKINDAKIKNHDIKKEKKPASHDNIEKAEIDVKVFLDEFLKQMGENITYTIKTDEYGLDIAIEGKQTGSLIGYRGETMYAVQSIISAVANKNSDEKIRVLVDIENYKEKREKTLQNLADQIAKKVERTKKSVTLEPMKAYERKIIHSRLQESTKVKTESIGEEPRRRIVISLK